MTNHNQPIFEKILPRGIRAKVWVNEHDGKRWLSPQLERSYKKGDQWARSLISLRRDDIPLALKALQAMHDFIIDEESNTASGSQATGEAA